MDRREMLLGLCAMTLGPPGEAAAQPRSAAAGVILDPAPPATPLHRLNKQLLEVFHRAGLSQWQMESLALPTSINVASKLKPAARRYTLPIVTTADFALARGGLGPNWHGYDRANSDLLFVSSLYDVGFGLQVLDQAMKEPGDLEGKMVAVPARPSAVRMITEALIGPGWGLREVSFVDTSPQQGAELLMAGKVSALAWNLLLPHAPDQFSPMLPPLATARYLPIMGDAIARMNEAVGFRLGAFDRDGFPPLVSFAQALAAWKDTPAPLISQILEAIRASGGEYLGLPASLCEMVNWPRLLPAEMHPAARRFMA